MAEPLWQMYKNLNGFAHSMNLLINGSCNLILPNVCAGPEYMFLHEQTENVR